eukprot:16082221-Heterocapsa_arctica.AAC.1
MCGRQCGMRTAIVAGRLGVDFLHARNGDSRRRHAFGRHGCLHASSPSQAEDVVLRDVPVGRIATSKTR